MISRRTIDEIISAAQVEEVINDYVNLKRRGANLIGLCPFHNEKTPSFTVSPSKNLYKCFGCGKGGGAISFLMEHEKFTYPEALKFLAKKYNIKVEEEKQTDEQLIEQQHKDSLLIINEMAADYFANQLHFTAEGRSVGLSYFKHRGLNENTMKIYNLGYSPGGSQMLKNHAESNGYKQELLEELGLVTSKGNDFFRERVIFPFHNLSGKVIGFGGRILKDNVKAPKYLNSPESKVYNKRQTLYGLYQARNEIRKEDRCILVEGYTDVLSLHQSEIKNVVSSSGTALTEQQVRLIKRFTSNVTVIYDSDEAGQKAALRGLNIFLRQGMNVIVVTLPNDEDPDSFVQSHGSSKFLNYLSEKGQDFIIMLANQINKKFQNDPVNKSIQVKELIYSLALISDQIKRSIYVKECAVILNMDERTLFREINKNIRSEISKRKNQYSPRPSVSERYVDYDPEQDHSQKPSIQTETIEYQERDIVRILVAAGDQWYIEEEKIKIVDYIISNLKGIIEYFKDPLSKSIISEYTQSIERGRYPNQDYWANHPMEEVAAFAIDTLTDKYIYAQWSKKGLELQTQKPFDDNYIKDSYQAIMRFKLKKISERITELKSLMAGNEDRDKDILLMTAFQNLLNERKEIANDLNLTVIS